MADTAQTGPAYGSGAGTGSTGGAGQQAQEKAQQVKEQATQQAQQAAGQARGMLRGQVDERSTQAGEQVTRQVGDLRSVSDQLRQQGKDGPAKLVDQVAERGERVGSWLKDSDADRILGDIEDVARRNPWAVLGGAVAVGFVASRLLKASSSRRYEERSYRGLPPAGGTSPATGGYRTDRPYGARDIVPPPVDEPLAGRDLGRGSLADAPAGVGTAAAGRRPGASIDQPLADPAVTGTFAGEPSTSASAVGDDAATGTYPGAGASERATGGRTRGGALGDDEAAAERFDRPPASPSEGTRP